MTGESDGEKEEQRRWKMNVARDERWKQKSFPEVTRLFLRSSPTNYPLDLVISMRLIRPAQDIH